MSCSRPLSGSRKRHRRRRGTESALESSILGCVARVAFVAHCLLNQNSRTAGGARCPGVYSPLVEELRARSWELAQMPCPELAFTGLNRFWAVRAFAAR
jgi:hypothetical protein